MINHVGLLEQKRVWSEQKDGLNWLLLSCPKSLVRIIVTRSALPSSGCADKGNDKQTKVIEKLKSDNRKQKSETRKQNKENRNQKSEKKN